MPVRRGVPTGTAGSRAQPYVRLAEGGFAGVIADPKFATGLGLVLYGAAHEPMRAEPQRRPKDEGRGWRDGSGAGFARCSGLAEGVASVPMPMPMPEDVAR